MSQFFQAPEHIWVAVLAAALTVAVATLSFALIVRTMLKDFLSEQRKILERATIQADSFDEVERQQNFRIKALEDGEHVIRDDVNRLSNRIHALEQRPIPLR